MPGSVKAYFALELSPFPEERAVLEAAYEAGVHNQVLNTNGENREIHFRNIAEKFSKQADVHPDWARWAVNVWSAALAEKPWTSMPTFDINGTKKKALFEVENRFDPDPQLNILRGGSPIWIKLIMTLIVMSGGFMGGAIGRCWPMAAIVLGFDIVDSTIGKDEYAKLFPENHAKQSTFQKVIGFTVFFIMFATPPAVASALGSVAGWWFGRADGRPWIGFGACFSAAFMANTILVMLCGCFVGVITSFVVCFTASFKVASTTT